MRLFIFLVNFAPAFAAIGACLFVIVRASRNPAAMGAPSEMILGAVGLLPFTFWAYHEWVAWSRRGYESERQAAGCSAAFGSLIAISACACLVDARKVIFKETPTWLVWGVFALGVGLTKLAVGRFQAVKSIQPTEDSEEET